MNWRTEFSFLIFDFWFRACQKQNSFFKSKFFFGEFSNECLVLHTGRSVGRSVRLGWQVRPDIVLIWLTYIIITNFFSFDFLLFSFDFSNQFIASIELFASNYQITTAKQNKNFRYPIENRCLLWIFVFCIGTV